MDAIPKVPNTALIREPRPWERPSLPKIDLGVPTKDRSQEPAKPKESKMRDLTQESVRLSVNLEGEEKYVITDKEIELQRKLVHQELVISELRELAQKQILTQIESELKALEQENATYLFVFKMFAGITASVLKRYDREENEQ